MAKEIVLHHRYRDGMRSARRFDPNMSRFMQDALRAGVLAPQRESYTLRKVSSIPEQRREEDKIKDAQKAGQLVVEAAEVLEAAPEKLIEEFDVSIAAETVAV